MPFSPRLLLPVTVPAVLVMVKVLENAVRKPPLTPAVKLPDSVKVPGKGPAAVPLTEKLKLPSLSPVQAPVSVDPRTSRLVKVSPASEEGVAACASTVPTPTTPRIRHPVGSNRRARRPAGG